MAINSYKIQCNQILPKSVCSLNSSNGGDVLPCNFVKIHFANDGSSTSATSKRSKLKKSTDLKSPYLIGDKVRLLSRITDKRMVQKKPTDFVSSFPLAANIYKANSDEFKSLKRGNKKARKSVLTLPNEPSLVPQTCTVSDMNDSEYFNQEEDNRKTRPKKRFAIQNNSRNRRKRDFEFYDRDARYCSQMNINLDCSSTDIIKNFNGDGKIRTRTKKSFKDKKREIGENCGHNVWAVLRNINRFQFRPSPPMSEDSIVTMKKKKIFKRRFNRKDTRFVGTCRTEEFAYISSMEVDSKSPTNFSQTSSFDRITVIDNEDEYDHVCKEFGTRMIEECNLIKDTNALMNGNQIKNKTQRRTCQRSYSKGIEPKPNIKLPPTKFDTKKTCQMRGPMLKESDNSNDCKDSLTLNAELNKASDPKMSTETDFYRNHKMIENLNSNKRNSQSNRPEDFTDALISSRNLNLSKAGLDTIVRTNADNQKIKHEIPNERKQMKGASKVVLSKGNEVCDESQKRKPRLVTTMPSTKIIPKSTQTDIKRRLANMKFPLVILGKDELCSALEVIDYNPPQFNGLDERIWPFMLDWNDENRPKRRDNVMKSNKKISDSNTKRIKCNIIPMEPNMNASASKHTEEKEKTALYIHSINKNKTEQNSSILSAENKHQKQKPIRLLKDKMLKFLYKKTPVQNDTEEIHQITGQGDVQNYKSPFNTGIKGNIIIKSGENNKIIAQNFREPTKRRYWSPPNSPNTRSSALRQPWSKAKWASDFIDNVINKIRNGVYYNQYNKNGETKWVSYSKEASIQTALTTKNASTVAESAIRKDITPIHKNDALQSILGFDSTLPKLKIKTLTKHQIEIKHCVANVMVQFDVKVPTEPDKFVINSEISSSLLPLEATQSETKVFKCKTIILNAMLPAELCSILPKMLGQLSDLDSKFTSSLLPISKTESHLSTIPELSHFENHEALKMLPQFHNDISPEIIWLSQGIFMPILESQKHLVSTKATLRDSVACFSIVELLPKLPEDLLNIFKMNTLELKIFKTTPILDQRPTKISQTVLQTCTALQPYNTSHRLTPSLERLNFTGMFENMWNYYKMNANVYPSTHFLEIKLGNNVNGKKLIMNLSLKDNCAQENNMALTIHTLNIDSLYEGCTKNDNENEINFMNYSKQRCIPYTESACVNQLDPKESQNHVSVISNKPKRKGFVKLYRKCRSATIISREKSCTLTKITNLDDFFELLGSNKSLSSVFGGCYAQKLLSSLIEMNNWITEINSRQALLVLLLINKKDTPNLVRFRPILLQGIAVNRITHATELDMEIEVIEREHFNKLSQYDVVSHMRASIENQSNLLEELYWIAKTTASDYQRPFDESSEKLLKSLLEKRKKLNPSYLRVMARYVGLGLLKLPCKN